MPRIAGSVRRPRAVCLAIAMRVAGSARLRQNPPMACEGRDGGMRVMACAGPGAPLRAERRPLPEPGEGQVLVRVAACGVCRTDLHVVDGELPRARPGVVPGHEVVGHVVAQGGGVARER
jgi:hypothetical protein